MRSVLWIGLLAACGDDGGMRHDEVDAAVTIDGAPDAAEPDAAEPDAAEPDAAVCLADTASDPQNCGRCGRVCGGTATCTDGLCSAEAILDPTGPSNYCGEAFTADEVFAITCWGSFSELRHTPLEPGAAITGTQVAQYTAPVVAMRGILVDGDAVYWGLEGSPSHVYKYGIAGGGAVETSITDDNAVRFDGLQLVGDTYYWIDNSHTNNGQVGSAQIRRRAKTDTADTILVSGLGLAYGLQVTDTQLVWAEARVTTSSVSIYSAPRAGAASLAEVTTVAPTAPGTYLAKRGQVVYWADKTAAPDGRLRRLDTSNATATAEDVLTGLDQPEGLKADATDLYFKQRDALYRVSADGAPAATQLSPVVSAHDTQATEIMYVDARYVYFAGGPTAGDSKIYRVAK